MSSIFALISNSRAHLRSLLASARRWLAFIKHVSSSNSGSSVNRRFASDFMKASSQICMDKNCLTVLTAKLVSVFLLGLVLTGCVGTNFTWQQASQVKVGMTDGEVLQIMGKPYLFNSFSNRVEWIYAWGSLSGQSRSVIFNFDTNGIVTSTPHIPSALTNTNKAEPIKSRKGK